MDNWHHGLSDVAKDALADAAAVREAINAEMGHPTPVPAYKTVACEGCDIPCCDPPRIRLALAALSELEVSAIAGFSLAQLILEHARKKVEEKP